MRVARQAEQEPTELKMENKTLALRQNLWVNLECFGEVKVRFVRHDRKRRPIWWKRSEQLGREVDDRKPCISNGFR